MKDQEIREKVRNSLAIFMPKFDGENRGNRISEELVRGLGGSLEDFMVEVIQKIVKGKQPPKETTE